MSTETMILILVGLAQGVVGYVLNALRNRIAHNEASISALSDDVNARFASRRETDLIKEYSQREHDALMFFVAGQPPVPPSLKGRFAGRSE